MLKNMKIEINDEQPLDEVVRELERLDYIQAGNGQILQKFIITSVAGLYVGTNGYTGPRVLIKTTLQQLKEM